MTPPRIIKPAGINFLVLIKRTMKTITSREAIAMPVILPHSKFWAAAAPEMSKPTPLMLPDMSEALLWLLVKPISPPTIAMIPYTSMEIVLGEKFIDLFLVLKNGEMKKHSKSQITMLTNSFWGDR
jgi:hypothetical protein